MGLTGIKSSMFIRSFIVIDGWRRNLPMITQWITYLVLSKFEMMVVVNQEGGKERMFGSGRVGYDRVG